MEFDLNSLRALDTLLRERNVTRAAARLSISQPAMSRTLARLRESFGDELLVRDGAGYALTTRAEQLIEPVRSLIADADSLMQPPRFDPALANATINIASLDIEMHLYLPTLSARLARFAPGIQLHAQQFSRADFRVLDTGEVDFVIVARESRSGRYRRRLLFANSHVCVMSRGLAKRLNNKLTLEDYTRLDHGLVSVEGSGEGLVDVALGDVGLRRTVVLRIPSFSLVPEFCTKQDIIFTIPRRCVDVFGKGRRLVSIAAPINIPTTSTFLYWHPRNHENHLNRWIRQQLFEINMDLADRSS